MEDTNNQEPKEPDAPANPGHFDLGTNTGNAAASVQQAAQPQTPVQAPAPAPTQPIQAPPPPIPQIQQAPAYVMPQQQMYAQPMYMPVPMQAFPQPTKKSSSCLTIIGVLLMLIGVASGAAYYFAGDKIMPIAQKYLPLVTEKSETEETEAVEENKEEKSTDAEDIIGTKAPDGTIINEEALDELFGGPDKNQESAQTATEVAGSAAADNATTAAPKAEQTGPVDADNNPVVGGPSAPPPNTNASETTPVDVATDAAPAPETTAPNGETTPEVTSASSAETASTPPAQDQSVAPQKVRRRK